ncbi:MAG: hypothetical protein JNL01_08810 [Bdellovibrionales bacterium]|nr:hypothetical protein [Bdellovibrionales bacterium]
MRTHQNPMVYGSSGSVNRMLQEESHFEIWKLRMDGELDAAREMWIRAKSKLQAGVRNIDLELLQASFLRAEGKIQASEKMIQECWRLNEGSGKVPAFQLVFQRGLTALYKSDRSAALSDFVLAKSFAENEFERLWVLNNILSSMDNMGLPYQATLKTLQEELDRAMLGREGSAPVGIRGVLQQANAFRSIHAFREGHFDRILSENRKGQTGQEQWLRLLTAELPFVAGTDRVSDAEREKFFLENPVFHVNSFRARTLQGVLHPEDSKQYRWGDFSDRVYLWTWRWLVKPEEASMDRVLSLISGLEVRKASEKLGSDDFQQIRNSLKWISLFDHDSQQAMETLMRNFAPATFREDPWFRYEELVIDTLLALRDGRRFEHQELLKMVQAHPVHQETYQSLSGLVDPQFPGNADTSSWTAFKDRLTEWVASHEQEKTVKLVIDLKRYAATTTRPRKTILSHSLCRAFELLQAQASVSCEEFLRECFGLPRYEPLIHQPKIFNLLSRMRQLAPSTLRFGVRDGSVFAEGDWESVGWVRPSASSRILAKNPLWKERLDDWKSQSPGANADRRDTAQKNQLFGSIEKLREKNDGISRRDIEEALQVSRATANRIIEKWVREGFLTREGRSRNIRYRLAQNL